MTPSQHNTFPAGRWTSIPAGTDQKLITLHRSGRSWFARWSGPEEARIVAACGTNDLCTGSPAEVWADDVQSIIQSLNPDYTVIVEG